MERWRILVVEDDRDHARALSTRLTREGFAVIVRLRPSIQPPGTVFEQIPVAGSMLPEGATVVIKVAS